jgi:hypothetical protein
MAKDDESLSLLGLKHPIVKRLLDEDKAVPASGRALTASMAGGLRASFQSGTSLFRIRTNVMSKRSFPLDSMWNEIAVPLWSHMFRQSQT